MSTAKRLALIAVGYAVAVAGGFAAVAVNELFMPADIAQGLQIGISLAATRRHDRRIRT
jgi:hypothetical protein